VSEDTRRFVETCCGDIEGWLCVAVGREPYRDDNGKYKHHKWDEVAFRWPAEADKAIDYITRASALGDVYTCPYPMKEMRRAKGQAARRVLIHADVDGDLDEAEVSRLGGFIVNSGSPGHGHVYVPLAWPVTPDQHEAFAAVWRPIWAAIRSTQTTICCAHPERGITRARSTGVTPTRWPRCGAATARSTRVTSPG
jgi:hypothetical protein